METILMETVYKLLVSCYIVLVSRNSAEGTKGFYITKEK